MKLRTKKSHFQTLPEGRAPRRILPVVLKFVYCLVLLGILLGLAYVVAMRYLYFTGRGQVETEKIKISSDYGGRIKTVARQAGEPFAAGDILAVVDTGIECPQAEPDIRPIKLAYDIKLKQSERDIYAGQLEELGKGLVPGILPRALEIGDSFTLRNQQDANRERQRLQEKIDLLAAEIAIKRKELAMLQRAVPVARKAVCGLEVVSASLAGSVYHVTHRPSEYVKEGEPLFIVSPEDAGIRIEAFFDKKYLPYLAKGQRMTIEFPDRSSGIGVIVDYLSSASYFAERAQKDYLPVEAQLRVNLKPADPHEAARWKRYDRMDVLVRGER